MRPTDLIDTGNGTITIGSRADHGGPGAPVRHAHRFADVIVKSSNVGAVKIGLRLGAERLGRYVERFGFGTTLSPDFAGESRGIVGRARRAGADSTLASVSMGYEVSVTPLQMAAAASARSPTAASCVQPRVVRAVIDGDRREPVPRKVIRRAISPGDGRRADVDDGRRRRARHRRRRATLLGLHRRRQDRARRTRTEDGHYSKTTYNASFVGFVPSRQPALTILVVIDTPRGPNGHYGGAVAAPIFQRIAEAALRYLGVPPTINPPPPVLLAGYDARATVDRADPPRRSRSCRLRRPRRAGQIAAARLRGLSGREALRILDAAGHHARMTGDGIVIEQEPAPGTPVEPGGACRLGAWPPGRAGGPAHDAGRAPRRARRPGSGRAAVARRGGRPTSP